MQRGSEDYRWLLPLTHTTDNLLYARECAMAGAGITLLPAFLIDGVDLSQPLARVLPEWRAEPNDIPAENSLLLQWPALSNLCCNMMRWRNMSRRRHFHPDGVILYIM